MMVRYALLSILSLSLALQHNLVSTTSEYTIPYDRAPSEFEGIESPSCGKEIEQMDVSAIEKPNQIRLSFTGDPTEMAITWTTNGVTKEPEVEQVKYGISEDDMKYIATSVSHQYKWHWDEEKGAWYYTSGFIHEALMINLTPGKKHFYQIESNGQKSDVIEFMAAPEHGSRSPLSFFHVGDVGTFGTSVMVTKDMMDRMEKQPFHGMIHCGDISYANKFDGERPDNAEQKVWDTWGQMVEPIGSKMAYMAVPGNHELDTWDSTNENGKIYAKRFILPGNERYFSYGVGMVHFVAVSTDESIDKTSTQGTWFENVLTKINEERDKWPWLVVYQHRPIYNSNKIHGNWTGKNTDQYSGPPDLPPFKGWKDHYETLLLKHKVDFVLNGHVHHYERTWPVRNRTEVQKSYENVEHPIHITCGHGGQSLYKYFNKTTKEDSYNETVPEFVSARSNVVWGHCELQFIDAKTVKHEMYIMGETEPRAENVALITKQFSGCNELAPNLILISILSILKKVF